jgi:phage gp29-like protein
MRPNFDEIAKITRDLNYAYIAGYKRLIGKDDILALKGGGDLKLYETVAQDDQVKSCVQQRISAVISRDWGVEPGDDSKPALAAADFIEQELKNLQWDRINEKMLWGSFYGYSVGEIMWRRGDKIGIADIKVRNRRRFNFGTDLQPKLITLGDPLGEDLPDQKFWHFCCGGDNDDDPYGRGLAHWLYWPTFFKRSDMRWWVTFLEKYAQPTRLGKYSPGASESDKDTLWQAMDAFGTNGKMMIPEGTMIELLEAARAGGADYQGMLDICNAAISKIVLSQTMTTDNGSSESQANVHQDVKDDIVKADADLVCSSFNEGPVKWLIDWNFPGVAYPRVWRQMDAAVDLTAEADRDTKLQGLGISLKPESIAAKYGDDYLIPDNKEQIPQLNSEQVNALVSIVSQAKQGGWSPELVAGMINGAFPNWPDEAVAAITKNLGSDKPTDQSVAPIAPSKPVDLDAISAQFAANGAVKAKKCMAGLSCGGSCISKTKICKRALSIEQQKAFKELKKRLKGGDLDAQKGIQDLKDKQQGVEKEPNPYDDQDLGSLFLEADRIGRKYQSQEEIDVFREADSKMANEIDDLIDEMYPDDAPVEDIGYTKKVAKAQAKVLKKKVSQAYISAFDNFRKKANDKSFDIEAVIKAVGDSDMRKMDKGSAISTLEKLDLSKESHVAYAKASAEAAGFYKKQEDGTIIDTDIGGTTSSFDRSSELLRISRRKEVSDDDARDAGGFLRQGLRGRAGSEVNKANVLLSQDIWSRLSDFQKDAFAKELPESYVETSFDKHLSDNPFIKELNKRRK